MINATSMKTIIVDLDRTLLHTDKTLSAYTVKVLKECQKCGIHIMVATARPERETKQYSDYVRIFAQVAYSCYKYNTDSRHCKAYKLLERKLFTEQNRR